MTPDKKCWQDQLISISQNNYDNYIQNHPKAGDKPYFLKDTLEIPPLSTHTISEILDHETQEVLFLRGVGMTYHPCTNYKILQDGSTPLYNNRDIIQEPNDFADVWKPPIKITKSLELSIYNMNKGKTKLDADISFTNQTIKAVSTKDYPTKGYIQIGSELIYYNSKSETEFKECQRGMDGTPKFEHPKYTDIYLADNILKYDVSIYGWIRGDLG